MDKKIEPMSGAVRGPIVRRLITRGWEVDFFQAVWLLERLTAGTDTAPVGGRGPVGSEAIQFRPHISVGFPATDVRRITCREERDRDQPSFQLDVTFMGLYGVATPLPLHYAVDLLRSVAPHAPSTITKESAAEDQVAPHQEEEDAHPVRDFQDILHHRLISLFYRSWAKYRFDVTFPLPQRDAITDYLLWMIGCPRGYGEDVIGVPPLRMIRYAGALTQHPMSSVMLEGVLSDYFGGLPARVEQFVGRWVPLGEEDTNRIGTANSRLGEDLTVGRHVYDVSGAINMVLGPVDWETYLTFLPDGAAHAQARSLAKLCADDPLSATIEIRLKAKQAPLLQLSSGSTAGRLGFTSWVRTEEIPETSVTFDAPCAA